MTVKELKEFINNISEEYDGINVWIDSEEAEGGKPLKPENINILNSEDCCLDLDEGCEYLTGDDLEDMFMFNKMPEPESFEFLNMIRVLAEDHYVYIGHDKLCGHRFARKILAITF